MGDEKSANTFWSVYRRANLAGELNDIPQLNFRDRLSGDADTNYLFWPPEHCGLYDKPLALAITDWS